MCATCGCADPPARTRHQHDDGTWHEHGAAHDAPGQEHRHEHAGGQTVTLEARVLARNDALARFETTRELEESTIYRKLRPDIERTLDHVWQEPLA